MGFLEEARQKISHLVHSHNFGQYVQEYDRYLDRFLMIDDSLIISGLVPTIVTTFIQPTSYEKVSGLSLSKISLDQSITIKSVSPTLTIL